MADFCNLFVLSPLNQKVMRKPFEFSIVLLGLQFMLCGMVGAFIPALGADRDTTFLRPVVHAIHATSPILIDGKLDEPEWRQPGITHFTQRDPIEGAQPTERTEVWVAYDDAALYIAARMYDDSPDSIATQMGRRDASLNADELYVGIDSYHDRRSGFYFGVYASGTVVDGTLYNDSWDDNSWDGVWDAATRIDSLGWTAEMRIPYSQLRFPKQDQYVWGVNFARQIVRKNERDDFVLVPKKESGWVSRFADLDGLHDINPPRKIELLPFIVGKGKATNAFVPGDPFNASPKYSSDMGVDLQLGLGNNLTLNATINPDFGQVELDPSVVNLTQYETIFQEKRPFFIEGSNFFDFGYGGANNNVGFNWSNPTYFYSRRIGRPPQGALQQSTDYAEIPDVTRILGAGKLTGKIGDNWSLGVLSAATERQYGRGDSAGVRFEDVVEPFTSYNVVRSLREFNEGRQGLGVIGTAVLRDLNQPYLGDNFNRRAYAAGIDGWTNLDADQRYVLTGWFSTTRVEGTPTRILDLQQSPLHYFQRPDAPEVHLDSSATSLTGYASRIAINKQKGNLVLNVAAGIISPGFDSDDLGVFNRTDVLNAHIFTGYQWFNPDGFFRRKEVEIATFRSYTFDGKKTGDGYFFFWSAQLMNYWNLNGNFAFTPATLDDTKSRGGPFVNGTNGYSGYVYAQSDTRNKIILSLEVDGARTESGGYRVTSLPGIQWKPVSNVSLSLMPTINRDVTIAQWVTNQVDSTAVNTYGSRYVFGKLDLKEISAEIRLDWIFSPRLSLQLYMQPLISVGHYDQFKELRQPGTYTFNRYGENGSTILEARDSLFIDPDGPGPASQFGFPNPDFSYKFLNVNTVLRWEYMPGSTIYLVWTRNGYRFDNPGTYDVGRDLRDLATAPDHKDAFLVKMTYWWNP